MERNLKNIYGLSEGKISSRVSKMLQKLIVISNTRETGIGNESHISVNLKLTLTG